MTATTDARSGRSAADPPAVRRRLLGYLLVALLPAGLALLVVRSHADAGTTPGTPAGSVDVLAAVLFAVTVVAAAAHLLGAVARRLGQPAVIGEMLAGIMLGPSLLGALLPRAADALFSPAVMPVLDGMAQVGVIFFMFLVGLELPTRLLRGAGSAALTIGHAAMAVPLLLGVLLALPLRQAFQPTGVSTETFILFVGVSVSVTAFPVLARILTDRGLHRTRTGGLGLGAAAVADVTCWCLLAVVLAASGRDTPLAVTGTVAATAVFVAASLRARPLLARTLRAVERRGRSEVAMVLLVCLLLLSALATHLIGVHAIFGAFLLGVIAPRGSAVVEEFVRRTSGFTLWVLLPLFFAAVGLRTHIQSALDAAAVLPLLLILAVAIVGKIGGTALQARVQGCGWPDALSLGAMMNCRGLTELIVLDIGRSLGVIDESLFALLVVMTLVTTAMTAPLLDLAEAWRRRRGGAQPVPDPDEPARAQA